MAIRKQVALPFLQPAVGALPHDLYGVSSRRLQRPARAMQSGPKTRFGIGRRWGAWHSTPRKTVSPGATTCSKLRWRALPNCRSSRGDSQFSVSNTGASTPGSPIVNPGATTATAPPTGGGDTGGACVAPILHPPIQPMTQPHDAMIDVIEAGGRRCVQTRGRSLRGSAMGPNKSGQKKTAD